jgi:hypothetical protein
MRFVDLTLARPLPRQALVIRTIVVIAVAGALMLIAMIAGTWTGLSCCVPADAAPPGLGVFVRLVISLATVITCWGGITLAIGSASRRRSVAAGVTGVLAFTAYLLDYLGRAWQPAATVSKLSPFHYFEPISILTTGTLSVTNVAVLVVVGIAGALVSYAAIGRRDI